MSRPSLEVADIFRTWGERFFQRSRARISWPQHKVMRAIERCRTAALGRHRDRCTRCGHDLGFSFNSCRNRHCPKCQTRAKEQWVAARNRELLPVPYTHLVFTLPHAINPYDFPEATEVVAVLELGLNRAIAGEITSSEALNSMSDDIYKVMEKYKYKTGSVPPLKG